MSINDVVKLFGSAWIVMMADVDAASILTGVADGQTYGYRLIILLLVLTLPLFIVQDAAGRVGAVNNGKGLGTILREKFSQKFALVAAIPMFLVDLFTYVIEYVGIAVGSLMIGVPVYISLPLFFVIHLSIVLTRTYEKMEKTLLGISIFLIVAFIVQALLRGVSPNQELLYFSTSRSFLFFLAANIGAVVMPFMIFYQASATAYKYDNSDLGKDIKVKWSSLETFIGALVSELLMVAIEVSTTGLSSSIDPLNYREMSYALSAISGSYSPYLFGIGLICGGLLALIVESLGSAWGTLEALNKHNYKNVTLLYISESIPAVLIAFVFSHNYEQIVNTILSLMSVTPIIVFIPSLFVGLLVSDKKIMGKYSYSRRRLVIYWITVALLLLSGIISLF
ncbi:NRAMP family Mn2+/Fe2+ transporter [Sulfolobus acidocaldarius SUSAZ]|nr:NRAMP family Mn2+/Fe2+ transporter [Sulfolobus acidocaldarius SUSAZ]